MSDDMIDVLIDAVSQLKGPPAAFLKCSYVVAGNVVNITKTKTDIPPCFYIVMPTFIPLPLSDHIAAKIIGAVRIAIARTGHGGRHQISICSAAAMRGEEMKLEERDAKD